MSPDFIQSPSPNWNERPVGESGDVIIDTVVLHYTGMKSAGAALSRMCDANVEVSAHYMIEEDGRLHQLVAPEKRAWHAGVSSWQGRDNLNHTSIGIELVNPGHENGYRRFPTVQIENLICLLLYIKQAFNIPQNRFIGHSDVAPERKSDPGELFPWKQLAAEGFGIWPDVMTDDFNVVSETGTSSPEIASFRQHLSIIGYNIENLDTEAHIPKDILIAFQRHWRPENIEGTIDRGTLIAAEAVAALTQESQLRPST